MATTSTPADSDRGAGSPPGPPLSIYAEMTLVGLILGVSTVAGKFATDGFGALPASAIRYLIAVLAFIPLVSWLERRWPRPTARDCGWFLVLGLTGYLGFGGLFYLGLQLTSASHAAVVSGANPIVTALISAIVLREALTRERVAGILLTMAGVALIVLGSGASLAAGSAFGDLIVVAALACWGFYSIFARRLIGRYSVVVVTGYSGVAGALLLLPVAILAGARPETLVVAPSSAWLGVLYSGTASTVLAYILMNRGIRTIGPTLTMVFTNLSPVWGVVAAWILRGEAITVWHLVAALLVVGGILLANRSGLREVWRGRGA